MAATAGEIANTASDLSAQATTMAETIGSLAQSAASLKELATTLDDGARGGVARNETLRALAIENRSGLDASAASLGTLGEDVVASAEAIESLGVASEEIRSFVTLVRKLARQSKLLALNAAMEAARAGEHGEGFAVVASEVRRLAAMSSDAAERTEQIVTGVLTAIQQSRESASRAVATADEVRGATARASDSFTEIEAAVVEAELWTASVEQTSTETNALVVEMTHRPRVARLRDGVVRRRDGAGRCLEPGAEREHPGDRRRRRLATAADRLQAGRQSEARLDRRRSRPCAWNPRPSRRPGSRPPTPRPRSGARADALGPCGVRGPGSSRDQGGPLLRPDRLTGGNNQEPCPVNNWAAARAVALRPCASLLHSYRIVGPSSRRPMLPRSDIRAYIFTRTRSFNAFSSHALPCGRPPGVRRRLRYHRNRRTRGTGGTGGTCHPGRYDRSGHEGQHLHAVGDQGGTERHGDLHQLLRLQPQRHLRQHGGDGGGTNFASGTQSIAMPAHWLARTRTAARSTQAWPVASSVQ